MPWLIKVKGELVPGNPWNNDLGDDFLQFLPGHFNCDHTEIEAFWLDMDGRSRKLKEWPYNKEGRFLGNQLEGE